MYSVYSLKTPATNKPLRLVEVKNFLRVDSDDDDILIDTLIDVATRQGEAYTGRDFGVKTYIGKYSGLSLTNKESLPFITIHRGPLISLTNVKVLKSSVFTDVDVAYYFLRETSGYSRLIFKTTPTADINAPYVLQIEFTAGYSVIPPDILVALKQYVLFLYENRGDVIPEGKNGMPIVTRNIYSKYRILNNFG